MTTPSTHLRLDGVSVSPAGRRVLTDVSLVVAAGERVGLVGENGSGKSTLLRAAAGLLVPDAGTVTATAPGGRVPTRGLLHQEPPFAPTTTVVTAVEDALAPVRRAAAVVEERALALAAAPDDAGAATAYAAAVEDAELAGVWDADARAATTLAALGLGAVPVDRPTGELSGGQRARLSLAWLLLRAPDVLLLDEPTNHLDDTATAHLRDVLLTWRGPVLLASHDRAFLDETTTGVVDLDPSPLPRALAGPLAAGDSGTGLGAARATTGTGGYTEHLLRRARERQRWGQRFRDEQEELGRLRAAVERDQVVGHDDWKPRTEGRAAQKFYADRNARVVSRRVSDARARLAELEEGQVRKPPAPLRFAGFGAVRERDAEPVLAAEDVHVPGRLAPTSLTVGPGEKWLVTGANGAGKSTLLHVLAGLLEPRGGAVRRAGRAGLLTQDVDLPDPRGRGAHRTVRQVWADLVGAARAEEVPLAATGLLSRHEEDRRVGELSLGQQRRLALAVLVADPPDVLLLDEPTNHLSLPLVSALEEAVEEHRGAVVIASHDRWLRRRWRGRHLSLHPVTDG
ncbi:ABC-F family ATP-binding cassette domain-containing protein [Kineococcus sp. SYSU DK004]|uniref:ABC-F family ATP-binding cassette domain-containing protein n=1 Tax=Kineococcus sp. SYSU DK004 TaxID=3383125 RepID=UPI003D7C5EE3